MLISRSSGSGETRRSGRIVDYTGEFLTLELAGGRQEQIPAVRVRGLETEKVADQKNADRLFAEGRFADAVVGYRKAVEEDTRPWVRREILAQLARCYRNMDQHVRAADTFLIILRSDPTTQWYDAIPLVWKPLRPDGEVARRATAWMADPAVPAAALIGASWLLSAAERDQAVETLRQLSSNADQRVALLAQAQLWRTELVTATLGEVRAWEKSIPRMEEPLRAGPYFVLGQGLARHSEHARAALAFFRTPILQPDHRDLAVESLLAAGEQLEKAGDQSGAITAYRELIENYRGHALVPLAEQRLGQLTSK